MYIYLRGELGYIKSVLLNLVCCNASPISIQKQRTKKPM